MKQFPNPDKLSKFKREIWKFYKNNKRRFPWRDDTSPYCVFVSEIMLQQTQANRVVEKYQAFLKTFPDFQTLAQAKKAQVLSLWQGLGYNRRALYLKEGASIILDRFDGELPDNPTLVDELPGIAHATASSIVAFAFNKPVVFIETNIRRVFIHFFFPNAKEKSVSDEDIYLLVEKTLDRKRSRDWYYALMDYGAMLKATVGNPNKKSKMYTKQSKFEGSDRQIRGQIISFLVKNTQVSIKKLLKILNFDEDRVTESIEKLKREGFITEKGGKLSIVEN